MAMVVVGMALGVLGIQGAVVSASPNSPHDDHGEDKGRSTLTVVVRTPEQSRRFGSTRTHPGRFSHERLTLTRAERRGSGASTSTGQ